MWRKITKNRFQRAVSREERGWSEHRCWCKCRTGSRAPNDVTSNKHELGITGPRNPQGTGWDRRRVPCCTFLWGRNRVLSHIILSGLVKISTVLFMLSHPISSRRPVRTPGKIMSWVVVMFRPINIYIEKINAVLYFQRSLVHYRNRVVYTPRGGHFWKPFFS